MNPDKKTTLPSGVTESPQETLDRAEQMTAGLPSAPTPTTTAPVAPQAVPAISPQDLSPAPVINVPEVPQANQLGNIADQAVVQAEDAFTQQQAAASTAAEATKGTALQDYLASIRDSKGIAGFTQEASEAAGITGIESELNDVNDKIRQEQLALRRATERIQEQGGGLAGGAQAEIANLQRESYAKQADLSLIQLAAQGKYDSAKAAVDRVVDAKLEQQKIYNDTLGILYQDAKDTFDKTEQREFETLLGNRNRALEAKKEEEKEIYNLALQAQLDGAPTDVVQQMMASQSKDQALAAGGQFIGALDREATRASIRSANASAARAETGRLLDLAEAGDQAAISELGLTTPDNTTPSTDEIAYARQYAATGTIPSGMPKDISFGTIQELAADLPKPDGTLVNRDTGVTPSNLSASESDALDNLYNAVNTDLPVLLQAWEEMNSISNLGGTGVVGGVASTINPSEANTRFDTAKQEFLSKLLKARSGAAVTQEEYDRYAKLVPGVFNTPLGIGTSGTDKLANLDNQIKSALDDKLSSKGLSIYGYSEVETGGDTYKVGEVITNEYGQQGRVNPDGSVTPINI